VELTVATFGIDDVHVTLATGPVVGCFPLPYEPVTVNCKVAGLPTTNCRDAFGEIEMESSPVLALLQPVNGKARQAINNAPKQKRFNIWVSWRFQQPRLRLPLAKPEIIIHIRL
jgi:hypothetical protein